MKKSWLVAVLYENHAARQEAQNFCEKLVSSHWANQGFDVEWRSFSDLADETRLRETAVKFAGADLLVFANNPHSPLPFHVRAWAEAWACERGCREGVFVAVTEPAPAGAESQNTFAYLRQLAHQAGMDYVNDVPECPSNAIPDAPEQCHDRAVQVTSTLDTIMRQSPVRMEPPIQTPPPVQTASV